MNDKDYSVKFFVWAIIIIVVAVVIFFYVLAP